MKTSLQIDDSVYEDAKKIAQRTGKTLSETISHWAKLGRNLERKRSTKKPSLTTANLGESLMNINNRSDTQEALDDDRSRY